MSSTTERPLSIEIEAGQDIRAMAFTPNGEYLVVGGDGVQVWRVEDGKQVATMEQTKVYSLAVSKDGKQIAGGTASGLVAIWNTETYKLVVELKEGIKGTYGVEFSPDSTHLVAASYNYKAVVWDLARRKQTQILRHDNPVRAATYSPQGDRIATAVWNSVRVWDSNDGRLLVDIPVKVTPYFNSSLLWFNDDLLVASNGWIKQVEASTSSTLSRWPIRDRDYYSWIALPRHRRCIAHSAKSSVTFWDASTITQLAVVQHPQDIHSITFSPDDHFLAIGGCHGKIIIQSLSHITDLIPLSRLHPTFEHPDIQLDDAILHSWKYGPLENADALLTATISESRTPRHHALACRSLVRARLRHFDTALVDANMAIEIRPSIIAYIAKSVAHAGNGERDDAYRECDIAFERYHFAHATFLLLVKAIVGFIAGGHRDAISRMDDLIATVHYNSICYVVQAFMYLLLGNMHLGKCDYEGAVLSFEHARAQLRHHSSQPLSTISLIFGWKFEDLADMIQQRLCEVYYTTDRPKDAAECFVQITSEFGKECPHGEHQTWVLDFTQRASEKLECLADAAMDTGQYDDGISYYTAALSLDLPFPQSILVKRGKAFLAIKSLTRALKDANQVIASDPSSPWGYEVKHAALHKAGNHDGAVGAFELMLRRIKQSSDPNVQRHSDKYIRPSTTRAAIRKIVHRTLRHLPRMLIDTTTGCLHDRTQQASAFQTLPIFNELVSSTTTRIDYARIKREVRQFFRYVVLSHTWEENEPLFEKVVHVAVYELDRSTTHNKLQTFCKIVRDAGFHWAWSDTCCIDKRDHIVFQEALIAMFKWFRGSAMMIVFLSDVRSSAQRGALVKSVWNTHSWALQEYLASKVVRFYTQDWTLYQDLDVPNHKESPEIVSEIEKATGMSAQQLTALSPGLTNIREKLRLASTRKTAQVEDIAYSLLGIFSVTGMVAIYGEGNGALGRLLAHILTSSGDVSILAWTGESGSFNSCLPADIAVFNGPSTSHLPPPVSDVDVKRITAVSRASPGLFDLDVALKLYDCLHELPAPHFIDNLLRLPCIAFRLSRFSSYPTPSGRVYRTDNLTFGMIEVQTMDDVTRMESLYLVHPWLDALLERENKSNSNADRRSSTPSADSDSDSDSDDAEVADEFHEPGPPSPRAPLHVAPTDRETRARRLVHRLRLPFGAILLASTGVNYRRVAADSLITVRLKGNVSLGGLVDNVTMFDVL